jgi:predicted nucleotidyltransferase
MALPEQQIKNWARALSETENSKCIATVSAIRKVLEDSFGSKVKVFLQGSYANSTNVRQDSDVDISVCYRDAYYSDLLFLNDQDRELHEKNRITHGYNFSEFKNDVESVLRSKFGTSVNRKEKCISIIGNTYRVNADVVPCFNLKRFESPYRVTAEGIQLFTDSGSILINFPDHHKANGQEKNKSTGQYYKSIVRILKNCRNNLVENNYINDKFMPSFFLECLVWNVPNINFVGNSYKEVTNNVIRKIYSDMADSILANDYSEINGLNWLFRGQIRRTPEGVKQFLEHAYKIIN